MAVMAGVFAVGQFSGAHLNPAVTLGFAIEGRTPWGDVPEYFAGEFVGAFIGATLVWLAYLDHWKETEDPGLKLACFSTAPAIRNPVSNLITEIIGTFVLVFGILAVLRRRGHDRPPASARSWSACSCSCIGLSLGGPTGYAINPARDLGPRIMHAILPIAGKGGSDWGYAWIPVVGPAHRRCAGARAFGCSSPAERGATAAVDGRHLDGCRPAPLRDEERD